MSRVAVDAGTLGVKEAEDGGWLCRCRSPQRTRQLSEAHADVRMGLPSLCGGLCHCTCTGMEKLVLAGVGGHPASMAAHEQGLAATSAKQVV